MQSLYDELIAKLARDPRLTKRGGPRFDLGLLLFNAREAVHDLWVAAEALVAEARRAGAPPPKGLEAAVEALRPIFGERPDRARR